MVKQVALLTAGCQPWNSDVCATTTNRFAYCATLAVYIFQRDETGEYRLDSIMSEHKKTITALCWNPRNSDQIVTVGVDEQVIVWDVCQQRVVARCVATKGVPRSVGWCNHEQEAVAFTGALGPLVMWHFSNPDSSVTVVKDTQNFVSEICQHRWHPRKPGRLVFGHRNGSLSIINIGQKPQRHVLQPEIEEGEEPDERVTALEWDPLSMDYILVSTRTSGVRLLDTEALTVIMDFDLPSVATTVHTLAWVEEAPGIFVTGDSQSGVLRIWNVSKSTPLENVRLKKTGFHCLSVVCNQRKESRRVQGSYLSSTSQVTSPFVKRSPNIPLPSTSVLCGFVDGGVGLYDLGDRKWKFVKEKGHMETIFDCEFRPDNPDILATSSFDGTIKVWDVSTMTPIASSPGNEGVIYCVSWAPADLNCIVASTSKHGAFIWDINKGKIVQRFLEHGSSSVFCVSWSKKDSARVLSCGGDGYCIVRQIDGTLIQRYKHPGGVYGGDWSPHNKDMLATGCEDKNVRVFYLATTSGQPLKVFSGHNAKVFRVRWSPLREGILCSGSDDGTIRVWDYTQEACVNVLSGHSAPVRGLLWNSEVPYLLMSGSWDYSIRIWDTRDGACIHVMLDHGADVYGLASHPSRPFIVASSSRDSTLRLWSITSVVQPIQLNLLAGKPWDTVIATSERVMAPGSPPMLTGKVSRELRHQIDRIHGNVGNRALRFFSKLFMPPSGTANVWELVSVVNGLGDSLLSPNYSRGIMHVKHLCRVKASEAQQLEMVKMSKFGAGLGAPSREDSLHAAAHLHIRLGNLMRYCELMVELGQWEKALAVSPGVSMEYWRGLSQRYASYLIEECSEDALTFCMATRDTESLVQYLVSQGQAEDAVLAAQVACEDCSVPIPSPASTKRCTGQELVNGDSPAQGSSRLLTLAIEALADWHFRRGCPTLAACCHLAVSDCQGAMRKLIRGNELELAVSVGKVLGSTEPLTHLALTYLARRCEDMGRWELAVDLLTQIPANEILLAQLCARCAASMDEINSLHQKAGFPSMDECLLEAEKWKEAGDTLNSVKYFLLSTAPESGLTLGINKVKAVMCEPGWQVDDVVDLLHLMGAVRTEKLLHPTCDRVRFELLSLCAYTGALLAVRRQYDDIVPALFTHARKMAEKGGVELPVNDDVMDRECRAWASLRQEARDSGEALTDGTQPVYDALLAKTGEEGWCVGVGADCAASTHLPSHSDVHTSYLTGHRIQGQAFFLEDGRSAISINEALMWAKVNPFSPLGSGLRINPF